MNLRNVQFRFLFALLAFVTLPAAAPAAYAEEPCCNITAINTQTGLVTATVKATGQVFQFHLSDASELKSLKVGQAIYANFATKQVSLDGRTMAGAITRPNTTASTQSPPQDTGEHSTASAASSASSSKKGAATKSMTVVKGDSTVIKASEGDTAMAERGITRPPQTGGGEGTPVVTAVPDAEAVSAQTGMPAAAITSIDAKTGVVTARVNATSQP